jgi:hypothetical protein
MGSLEIPPFTAIPLFRDGMTWRDPELQYHFVVPMPQNGSCAARALYASTDVEAYLQVARNDEGIPTDSTEAAKEDANLTAFFAP